MYRIIVSFLAFTGVVLFSAGCWNNVDSTQQAHPAYSQIPFGPAFENAFTDCIWKTIPGEGKEKQVQFDGKISAELHTHAVGKLKKVSKITVSSRDVIISARC